MAIHNELGRKGEKEAISYLEKQDYTIIATNWRFRHLEVDIIAQKGHVVCFVEVKTRRNTRFGEPYQAFTKSKQKNILIAANHYIRRHQINLDIRFDLITIVQSNPPQLTHYEEVFVPFIF